MRTQFPHLAVALCFLATAACATPRRSSPSNSAKKPARPISVTPDADRKVRPPSMLWWQGEEPECASGTLGQRKMSWGSVYWCELPNTAVDASLQNDLGRLARCIHDSVGVFQEEPEPDKLGDFLVQAHEAGLDPVLCGVVRRDTQVRSYHGRTIMMERRLQPDNLQPKDESQSSDKSPETGLRVQYRFSCADCIVAAETSVELAR